MNLELFIAKRLYGTRKGARRISRPAVAIAQWGVAIGAIVMFVSICIIVGFKQQVRDKIIGFGGHIQLLNYSTTTDGELPLTADKILLKELKETEGISHVQCYTSKPGMIVADNEYEGIVIKGVGADYDLRFFKQHTVEGVIPQFNDSTASNLIVISRLIANRLEVKTGDKINIYFLQNGIKARRMTVAAIYETHLHEMDNVITISDIYTTRRLNNWNKEDVTAIEITATDFRQLYETRDKIAATATEAANRNEETLYTPTIEEIYPALFGWLGMLDQTVWIILILVLCIAGFTMVSGLLILILEKTSLIGILKAVGARDISIRRIFIYYACIITGKGLIAGNIIGTALCLIQQQLKPVELDPEMYYMDRVPIEFTWLLIPMNIGMFILSVAMLVLPSMLVSRIEPTKAIRFE